jgi:hypothetical protein
MFSPVEEGKRRVADGRPVTGRDELLVLVLLLSLAAMLYVATWFIEGPPAPGTDPDSANLPLRSASR